MWKLNEALRVTPTITETNEQVHTSAAVILKMIGYQSNHGRKQYPPGKQQLEAKIKAVQRELSQLMGALRGAMKRQVLKSSSQVPEAVKTAKHRLQALAGYFKRHSKDNKARRENRLFATQRAKVCAAHWLKELPALHESLAVQMNQQLVLTPKGSPRGKQS